MGRIVCLSGPCETVGELAEALNKYAPDLPIECEMSDVVHAYLIVPEGGETTANPAGRVCVEDYSRSMYER